MYVEEGWGLCTGVPRMRIGDSENGRRHVLEMKDMHETRSVARPQFFRKELN